MAAKMKGRSAALSQLNYRTLLFPHEHPKCVLRRSPSSGESGDGSSAQEVPIEEMAGCEVLVMKTTYWTLQMVGNLA